MTLVKQGGGDSELQKRASLSAELLLTADIIQRDRALQHLPVSLLFSSHINIHLVPKNTFAVCLFIIVGFLARRKTLYSRYACIFHIATATTCNRLIKFQCVAQ